MPLLNRVILVTGANRGIGFSIIQATALRHPTNVFVIGCRSITSGQEAITKLQKLGVVSKLEVVQLDVTNDEGILAAVKEVRKKWGRLDVLVNNAGIASFPKTQQITDLRENFNTTFNINISSVMATTTAFLPLLHESSDPRVMNVSSGRASLGRSSTGKLPPTQVIAYSISKTALNALGIELQRNEDALKTAEGGEKGKGKTIFWAANPGHCKTAFNGYKGTKDPLDGAEVVVRLLESERGVFKKGGFYEFEEGVMREVPW